MQEKLLAAGARGGGRKEESIASWVRERSFTRRCYTKTEPKVTHSCPRLSGNYAKLRDVGRNILPTYLAANSPGGLPATAGTGRHAAWLEIPA